ncbi:hypothetical protein [Agriterribacter sp.]|uniref:hypothetical protein n=1 Tax=Agriterribacter sp. TaxID=2821509 RepID=UPI002C1E75C2|nr:hypothetical protein [Agriterribacter sp.]HRO44502.1 hypothetical protein [Agriterribacter sp.]HRQ16472.1 hypothetical protein [Agriterribacter sp.]
MRFLLTILLCSAALQLYAQTDTVLQSSSVVALSPSVTIYTGKARQFAADNLGNVYVLTPAGLLIKFNDKGDTLNVFNEVRRYGTVYAMDVTNPMKVLLYYKDFSTIVMLDRYLNRINVIDLRKTGIFQAKAVGLSYDNNVWIFDEQSAKLKKIDENGRLLIETADLRQVLDVMPSPVKITDRDGFVYMYDAANGLYIFDYYGTLKNTIALTGISDLQITGKTIAGRRRHEFVRYTPGTLELKEAPLPVAIQQAEKIYITQRGIYVLNDTGIELYPIN